MKPGSTRPALEQWHYGGKRPIFRFIGIGSGMIVYPGGAAGGGGSAAVEILSTSKAEPGSRLDLWREQVQLTCGALQVLAEKDDFSSGTIRTRRFGDTQVSLISAD